MHCKLYAINFYRASGQDAFKICFLSNHAGGPRIPGDIQFQLTYEVDAATPVFTLTCNSAGVPDIIVS